MAKAVKMAVVPKKEDTYLGIPVSKLNKAGLWRMNNEGHRFWVDPSIYESKYALSH